MAEPATIIAAVAALGVWLDRLLAERRRRSEAWQAAIDALSAAISRTRSYQEDLNAGLETRTIEHELAQLWGQAASSFAAIDEAELSALFRLKSTAWSEPSKWSDEQVRRFGITLQEVEARADELRNRPR